MVSRSSTRWLVAGVLALVVAFPVARSAQAQDSGFGLGLILGDPNGIDFKGYVGPTASLEGAIGFGIIDDGHLHAHLDFLWEFDLTSFDRADMLLHVGVGPKIGLFFDADEFRVGARGPVGLTFQFTNVPLDFFIEVAAGLWFIDDVDFDLDAAVGLRYWF